MLRLVALFSVCFCALAQSDRGTITGRVLDPSGAAVTDAAVTATNQGTKVKFSGTSNLAGNYSIQQLPVGRYEVTAEAPGFHKVIQANVDINVAQTVTLNFNLPIGEVTQAVEVRSAPELVESSTSDVGTVVTQKQVIDLPLAVSGNMRNPESFIFLTPGVSGDTGNTQINGSQSRAKEILVDGIGAASPESGGLLFTYPSVEAISEFKLLGSNFNAEYGRTGGGFEIHHTFRLEPVSRLGLRLPAQQCLRCPRILRAHHARQSPERVRRFTGRPHHPEQDLFLCAIQRVPL